MPWTIDDGELGFIVKTINKATGNDNKTQIDATVYENNGTKKSYFLLYINVEYHQIMLEYKNRDLYSNSYYHPFPHDYDTYGDEYTSQKFKTAQELIDYVKTHLKK